MSNDKGLFPLGTPSKEKYTVVIEPKYVNFYRDGVFSHQIEGRSYKIVKVDDGK